MTGSYLFNYESYYNRLITDLFFCSTKIQRNAEVTKSLGRFLHSYLGCTLKRSTHILKLDFYLVNTGFTNRQKEASI